MPNASDYGFSIEGQLPTRIANKVIRDPAVKGYDSYRVVFNGRLCSPNFNSKGAAAAYLEMLVAGRRKPEYS
jgi:hypothetical protein